MLSSMNHLRLRAVAAATNATTCATTSTSASTATTTAKATAAMASQRDFSAWTTLSIISPTTMTTDTKSKSTLNLTLPNPIHTIHPIHQIQYQPKSTLASSESTPSESVEIVTEPSLEMAQAMTTEYKTMPNSNLILLAALDSPPIQEARAEVLKRHIMSVDKVSYTKASETFTKINTSVHKFSTVATLPYKLGIGTAVTAGFASFPMCFHLEFANWFNTHFVTTDVPEPRDLETILEVGSWTWNWMEPPLGQISFFLLCLQFARSQIQNLGLTPYTEAIKVRRANRVAAEFSQYDKDVISSYVKSVQFAK